MAITQANIFAYQARREGHNEHSFVAFILDLTRKIHQLGRAYESNVVLFLDNAPFHTSGNAMRLLKMLPFPVFFNAANWSDMNPIESVFSILKARLKKLNPRSR
jgi:transposase